ncbi:MAG: succinate dehydrogenase iron-sulfur subunit [Candidatus Aminicenantes bacterium]|nr:succinate dehydrogenase iron-sulfur subunit [Candidatus Aminicenantes bacterium]
MKVILEIQRYDPEKHRKTYFQSYELEAEPEERLLTVLMRIKRELDPSLGFRKSCAHGVCGSDAMVVNGKERLACKTLIKDVVTDIKRTIRVEPLKTLPLQRDLLVDQTRFFQNYMQIKPFLINPDSPPEAERRQSPEERERIDEGTSCILCASCYSACPIIQEKNPDFLGPAAVIQAARFLDDSRDRGFAERLPELDKTNGIWPCENQFECTRVCPRGIKITKTINLTKRSITKFKEK